MIDAPPLEQRFEDGLIIFWAPHPSVDGRMPEDLFSHRCFMSENIEDEVVAGLSHDLLCVGQVANVQA